MKIDGLCWKKVPKILENFENGQYPSNISIKYTRKFQKSMVFSDLFLDFFWYKSIFGLGFDCQKRLEFLSFFMQKAVKFCKNPPEFKTLTGSHGITFNKVILQSQEFFMILLSGNLKVQLEFSPVTKVDLSLLAIAKFNSVIQLNWRGL